MADPDERWPGGRNDVPDQPGLSSHPGGRGGQDPGPAVIIEDDRWRRLHRRPEDLARRAAIAAGGAGTVVLSSDLAVKRLNADHRGRNKPTNVLTFEARRMPGGFLGGDIILAWETVQREAAAAGRNALHHMAHLVVHGALHLRGFDHELAGDARRMEMAETRILHRLGIANPWKGAPGNSFR